MTLFSRASQIWVEICIVRDKYNDFAACQSSKPHLQDFRIEFQFYCDFVVLRRSYVCVMYHELFFCTFKIPWFVVEREEVQIILTLAIAALILCSYMIVRELLLLTKYITFDCSKEPCILVSLLHFLCLFLIFALFIMFVLVCVSYFMSYIIKRNNCVTLIHPWLPYGKGSLDESNSYFQLIA